MFTGLVEEIGIVESVAKSEKSSRITIKARKVLEGIKIGDSISTNGVCLTVTSFNSNSFTVDIMAETIRRSNLEFCLPGDEVNLERALRLGDRLGGHIVSGHIDGMGTIEEFMKEDNAVWITVKTSPAILRYIVEKGSIAIDGVSLTVAYVDDLRFKVSIIPHTKAMTNLLKKKAGDKVNLECDILGKYIEKFLRSKDVVVDKKEIDLNFLAEHGFI
ncbi:MAG: riboflavin synthase [Clostridiales bacterium]|uniref:riboflavin synthase n=1 Tax=Clostridium sp. N3C TaxID=1776758 RepID=UPI00092E0CA4|nr:riboflavin synthase [Clostridium sp. N3C]NLZ49775.1 riboflavin synthase [Clostridiales bacterium]SCN24015.1 Riboflavin synthase [Clostridium sp. N3C]